MTGLLASTGDDGNRRAALRVGTIVFLVALGVRLAYFVEYSSKPYFGAPVLDSRYTLSDAAFFAEHWGFAHGPFFRPPLYTVALGLLTAVAGNAVVILAPLLQLAMGAGFCVLMFLLAARCWSLPAGAASGALAALCAPLVFYEGEILSDGAALFLTALFLVLWVAADRTGKPAVFAWAGIVAGLSAITRPNMVLILGVLLIGKLVIVARKRNWRGGARALLATLVPFLLVAGLPTARNALQGDAAYICTQGGINFFIGNSPTANGTNVIIPRVAEEGGAYRDAVEEYGIIGYLQERHGTAEGLRLYRKERNPGIKPSELSGFWYRKGLAFLRTDPAGGARLYLRKLVALINNHEVRNNRDFTFYRDNELSVLKALPVGFGLVFALGVAGACLSLGAGRRGVGWLLLYQVGAAVGVVVFFVAGRLRLPFLVGLFPLAGIAVEQLGMMIQERRYRAIAAVLGVVLFAGAFSCYSWPQLDYRYSQEQVPGDGIRATSYHAGEYALMAVSSLDNGKPAVALEYARSAAEHDPLLAYARLLEGNAALSFGQLDESAVAYRRAIELEPLGGRAYNNLAVVCEKRGRFQEAASLYALALRVDPGQASALGNLAMLRFRSGDLKGALEFAEAALADDPGLFPAVAVVASVRGTTPDTIPGEMKGLLDELSRPIPAAIDFDSTRPLSALLDAATTAAAVKSPVE